MSFHRIIRMHHINQLAAKLREGSIVRLGKKKKMHAQDGKNVRAYIALLKTTDPYKGSKAEAEHRKLKPKGLY